MKKLFLTILLSLVFSTSAYAKIYEGMSFKEFLNQELLYGKEGHGPILLTKDGKYFVNIKNKEIIYIFKKNPSDKLYKFNAFFASNKPKLVKWFSSNDLSKNWSDAKDYIVKAGSNIDFIKGNPNSAPSGDLDRMNVSQYISSVLEKKIIVNSNQNNSINNNSNISIEFNIKQKKEQCTAIGFKPETEKFADCVLRLVELDVKTQQQNQINQAQNSGNDALVKQLQQQQYDRGTDALLNLGQQLLNPRTTNSNVYMPQTQRCTIQGFGTFAKMVCR